MAKALSDYAKADLVPGDREAVLAEMKDDNDRAFVILTASLTETVLTRAIKNKLPNLDNVTEAELFGVDRPLGTYSSKIKLGYAVGLYGRQTKAHLERVREIRNACAHSRKPISFATPELAAVAALFPADPKQPTPPAGMPEHLLLRLRYHAYIVSVENALLAQRVLP